MDHSSIKHKSKEEILRDIEKHSAAELATAIFTKIVSLDDLKGTFKLNMHKREQIEKLIQERKLKEEEEKAEWDRVLKQNSIAAYKSYLTDFPLGLYVEEAREKIASLGKLVEKQKQRALHRLRNIGKEYDTNVNKVVIDYIERGELTKQDLIDEGLISPKKLDLLLNPRKDIHNPDLRWENLEKLKIGDNYTDVYFFGEVASGKSSLLAGILTYANRRGKLRISVDNFKGSKYGKSLIRLTKDGVLPPSTPMEAGVNYIEVDFFDNEENIHPLNFVEMSGEFFRQTYEGQEGVGYSIDHEKSIGAKEYLKNDNRKLIFLVVDYQQYFKEFGTDQQANFETVLDLLDKGGTFERTEAIYMILTKSDLLENGAQDYEATNKFLKEHYNNLRGNLRRYSDSYGFRVRIFPFSLGDFQLAKVFEYREDCSKTIFEEIIEVTVATAPKRSGGKKWPKWLGG